MEAILAFLAPHLFNLVTGALIGSAPFLGKEFKSLIAKYKLQPILAAIDPIMNVLDVLLGSKFPEYNKDRKIQAIKEVILALSDADLSAKDLELATDFVIKKFNPAKFNPNKELTSRENEVVEKVSAKLASF